MEIKVKTKKRSATYEAKSEDKVPHKKIKTSKKNVSEEVQQLDETSGARKKVKKAKTNGEVQTPVDEATEHETAEPSEKPIKIRKLKTPKKNKDFKFLEFRKKLKGTNFIAEIRKFLELAKKPRVIVKYLEKRGKPLELVEAFDRLDKENVLHIGLVCEALHLVIIEILAHQKQHMNAAEQACRYFLKTHSSVIDVLLNSPQLEHRRLALRLLTSIVCVDAQLGRQLLNTSDILSNVSAIEKFLSHSDAEVNQKDSVRKCFIHFVLAYLIDGNVLLIRNILDRAALIRSLISGLLYDDHVTVCMVISTLRKYVLECGEISKTKKYHVFDQDCCKALASLYEWYGPKVYAARCKKQMSPREMQEMVDKTEQKLVIATLHEFLVILFTSRKNGICFNALKTMTSLHYKQKQNALQGKVIFYLYKPWTSESKTDLVVKILIACPELGRQTVRGFSGIVNFLRTLNIEWVAAAEFLTKIIDTLEPILLHSLLDKLTLTDWTYWIKDVCLPMETLTLLANANVLSSKNYEYRLAAARLLLAMFRQYSNYVTMQEREAKNSSRFGNDSLRRFKLDLLNHILVHFPTVEKILMSLNMTIELGEVEQTLTHLEVVLDLILVICKRNLTFVNKTRLILKYLELVRPLYSTDTADKRSSGGNIRVELKAVKTMLALFPKSLSPQTTMFKSIVKSFINALVSGEEDVSSEARTLLRQIFKNTGFFESSELEIDLWLEALRFVEPQTVDIVTLVFIEVLELSNVEIEMPASENVMNKSKLDKLFRNIDEGLSIEAYVEIVKPSQFMKLILQGIELSEDLNKYLEIVNLLLFHYLPMPTKILDLYSPEFNTFTAYMQDWLSTDSQASLLPHKNKLIKCIPNICEVQKAILTGVPTIDELFAQLTAPGVNIYELMMHTQLVLFMVAQLSDKQKLTNEQGQSAAHFIIAYLKAIVQHEAELEVAMDGIVDEHSTLLGKTLHYMFRIRFSQMQSFDLFDASNESQQSYVNFICTLTEYCKSLPQFADYTDNLKQKVVKAIAIDLKALNNHSSTVKNQKQVNRESGIKLVQCLDMDVNNCLQILHLLSSQLKPEHYYASDTLQPSIYFKLLVCVLQQLVSLKKAVNCADFMHKFVETYLHLIEREVFEMESVEQALHDFLLISPHNICVMKVDFFESIFRNRRLHKSTIKLACLLLERNDKLNDVFLALLGQHMDKRELIYPLLQTAFMKNLTIEQDILQNIYGDCKKGLMKAIEKPRKAVSIYREYVLCGLMLIKHCMPQSECLDYCQKQMKFDTVEYYQLKLLYGIFSKAIDGNTTTSYTIHVNFINTLVQMLALDLKQKQIDFQKLKLMAFFMHECFSKMPADRSLSASLTKIYDNQNWLNFCKLCLKIGMQSVADTTSTAAVSQVDAEQGFVLQLLALLCEHLFADWQEGEDDLPSQSAAVVAIYEMIPLHSQFRDILLSQQDTAVKTQILHLLYTLAKKEPYTLTGRDDQIVVLLGAYQARLNNADRYTLALLQLYEKHASAMLHSYRPFVWGESAINFYGLRAEQQDKLSVQETTIEQVMSLFDRQICEYTLENYPVWRKLQTMQQMPKLEFHHPEDEALCLGYNSLEISLERGHKLLDKTTLRLGSSRPMLYEQCYDPAFLVPLMASCFAPGMYAHPARPVENGLLALSISALSAHDSDMRLAAGFVQMRYRAHFEQHKFATRVLWSQIYNNMQAGLQNLNNAWLRYKQYAGDTPRVPLFSALFVARTLQLSTDPTNLLYKELIMHLRMKDSFNFQSIPDFNVLFFSRELEHQQFRQFIVDIIRHGLKSSSEVFLLVMTNTLKVLLGSYGSSVCNLDMTLMLLSIVSKCAKIPTSAKLLIEHVGILSWLHTFSINLKFHQFDIIEGIISITYNLWYSLRATERSFHNFSYLQLRVHELVLQILPHMSTRITVKGFSKLMRVLQQTHSPKDGIYVSEEQLSNLINCAACHFPANIYKLENIKACGGHGVETNDEYCRQLHAENAKNVEIIALSSLRCYTLSWWRNHNETKHEIVSTSV